MADIEDLVPGVRVRVPRRENAAGTVEAPDPVGAWHGRAYPAARPCVHIKLDGAGWVLNYPADVEVLRAD